MRMSQWSRSQRRKCLIYRVNVIASKFLHSKMGPLCSLEQPIISKDFGTPRAQGANIWVVKRAQKGNTWAEMNHLWMWRWFRIKIWKSWIRAQISKTLMKFKAMFYLTQHLITSRMWPCRLIHGHLKWTQVLSINDLVGPGISVPPRKCVAPWGIQSIRTTKYSKMKAFR